MRSFTIAAVVAGGLMAACDDPPENDHAAACLKILRAENGAWLFGSEAAAVAEPFCLCVGEQTAKSERLDAADKAKILAYLGDFDPNEDVVAIGAKLGKFRDTMGGKFDGFKTVLNTCRDRLTP